MDGKSVIKCLIDYYVSSVLEVYMIRIFYFLF